jgi:hypothetical protein
MDDKQQLVAAAQELARRLGKTTITRSEFRRETGHSPSRARRRFGGWNAFCLAAGLVPVRPRGVLYSDDEIFAAMRDAFLALGRIGPKHEFNPHFRLSNNILWLRGWMWREALYEFRRWLERNDPAFPYLDQLPAELPPEPRGRARRRSLTPRNAGQPVCGDLLGFRCFACAPTNEIGVAMLFTLVAAEFGFRIEAVQTGFPDCHAWRQISPGRWRRVRIEFEFQSRNFIGHNHDPAGCDLIVCWADNWGQDCPVPVFELKSRIRTLNR